MSDAIQFNDLQAQYRSIKPSVDARIQAVLDHGQYILGPEVRELEAKLAAYTGAKHCIGVASGTEALLIALMALGVGPGDEVITTSATFVATLETIVLVGATPVCVDIDPATATIDPAAVAAAITAKTRAIVPVSLFGQCADMDAINAIAEPHGIAVIEDAAQSFGATYKDRRSCHTSLIGCTSFFPAKGLGCYGDGGAIFTDDDDLAQACREIRVHGQPQRYRHTRIGVGGRLDTIQAAVLLAKLEIFDDELAKRTAIGERYVAAFAGHNAIETHRIAPGNACSWSYFSLKSPHRDAILATLKAEGIPTAIYYPEPMHVQPAYAGKCRVAGDLAETTRWTGQVFSLPMHPYLTEEAQDRVIDAVLAGAAAAV
ncbi:MAG TPA: DegT/DnrJ/EryC1/StrS family aminotransferase [Sphingopyxis sp.]|mgnify:CR=1 FL=1|nr:DegT/DnrJ/EryC1/StrS family aminotransferase [Sphingopyxis sp.]HMP44161.1 DegT/DnrJ/EryC1/StrS family aminotransferase [Sphingopyxis sp.]HMQ18335.1 DegT/DnrJ/EryC1/StrS family aminotransferase [Sphingopyxis sp.]